LLSEALGDDTAEIELSLLPLVDKPGEANSEAAEDSVTLSLNLQEQMTDDLAALADGMADFVDAGKAIKTLPDTIQALSERLEKVERQLRQRPRASRSPETELDGDTPVGKAFKGQMAQTKTVMGLEVYENVDVAMAARANGEDEDYGL
jgi:hypothetical protein